MCGRFAISVDANELQTHFALDVPSDFSPRYNAAPGQRLPIVTNEMIMASWGLHGNFSLINARAESVKEKPSFADAFKHRRCLIPATGFFEWKTVGSSKLPFYFALESKELFAFAGLYEVDGTASFTIITTEPNATVKKIHD